MTRRQLQPFCARKDKYYYEIETPFNKGDYTYATNGHVVVRVPKLKDRALKQARKTPNVDKIFADAIVPEKYIPVPNPGIVYMSICDEHRNAPYCDCDGTGFREGFSFFKVGKQYFQKQHLRLLRLLPGVEIGLAEGDNAAHFQFDGGDGLLMPLNPEYMLVTVVEELGTIHMRKARP